MPLLIPMLIKSSATTEEPHDALC